MDDGAAPDPARAAAGRTVRSSVWVAGELVAKDIAFADVSEHLARPDHLVWVDLCDPDDAELDELAHELDLDPLAVEDVVAHLERTKAIRYSHYTVLTAYAVRTATPAAEPGRTARDDRAQPDRGPGADGASVGGRGAGGASVGGHRHPGGRRRSGSRDRPDTGDRSGGRDSTGDGDGDPTDPLFSLERVSAFVLPRGLVTVRHGDGFDMAPVVQRWDDDADLLRHGVGALVHGLLDTVVDGHFEAVQSLDDAMEDLEEGLFDQEARTTLVQRRTYQLRKDLVALRRVALPMRDLVNTVLRHRRDTESTPELDASYDDLYDHVLRVAEWTESLRDMVSTIFETNLSLQDQRLNTVMKKLTSWAAIIAVPTAITGYFGQNVPYPGFSKESGFYASLVLIVVIAGALYVGFRRRNWL